MWCLVRGVVLTLGTTAFGPANRFAESGLTLDRLKALVEVGASGSIAKASVSDPVRQSQYSRQIKELEDFFKVRLVERQGKGVRLTSSGRELARISRFFLLGLSNFQRGCLNERQTFRIAASATVIQHLLMPVLATRQAVPPEAREVLRVDLTVRGKMVFAYALAWNPRLLRLNIHAMRTRDSLIGSLRERLRSLERY